MRTPWAGPQPAWRLAASLPAAATSAEQTTGVFGQLLGWVLHPSGFCALISTLLTCPELPGIEHTGVYLLCTAIVVATAVWQNLPKEHVSLWCYHSPFAGISKTWTTLLNKTFSPKICVTVCPQHINSRLPTSCYCYVKLYYRTASQSCATAHHLVLEESTFR